MTIHEALRMLSTPPVYQRIHAERERLHAIADSAQFQAALLATLADTPLIQQALRVFWNHYATLLDTTVAGVPPGERLN